MATASATQSAFVPAPSGVTVDFDNPRHNGMPMAYYVTGVFLAFASLSLAMRVYTRIVVVKEFKMEDCKFTTSQPTHYGMPANAP